MTVTLCKQFRFEAAHFLPNVPPGHPCRRLHGHSYRIEVAVRGEPDPVTGWLLDFGSLRDQVRPVLDLVDHNLLNAVRGLENPTSENLAAWIWKRLAGIPGLCRVSVMETGQTRCDYEGPS